MTSPLTREKVISEIEQIARKAVDMDKRLHRLANDGVNIVRDEFDEWMEEIFLSKKYVCQNEISFKEVELRLMDIRHSAGLFENILHGFEKSQKSSEPQKQC